MKDFFQGLFVIVLWIVLIMVVSFLGFQGYSYFAPKYRAVDNAVFKESEQYNDGMIRDLENLQLQYAQANDTQKAALKDIILHRFAVYDENRLPANLRLFYNQLRAGQL